MLFQPNTKSSRSRRFRKGFGLEGREILHVLEDNLSLEAISNPLHEALGGQQDVYIARAELDLRKAFQIFTLRTRANIDDLPTAVALNLPENLSALLWVLNEFFDEKNLSNLKLENLVSKRNHEARLLFKALGQMNLDQWYDTEVDKLWISSVPSTLSFPIGHPMVRGLYRQYPLPHRDGLYLPIGDYFSLLMAERQEELLQLLKDLGAREIKIESLSGGPGTDPQVIQCPGYSWPPGKVFNPSPYRWFAYESAWQSLVRERISGRPTITPVILSLDYNGRVAQELKRAERLINSFETPLPLDYDSYYQKIVRSHRISVQF